MSTINADNFPFPLTVPYGGTSTGSFTTYAPICGGTTSTSGWQSATSGTNTGGYVLTSNGPGSLPSWSNNSPWVLLSTITASNSASVVFTPTSKYNTYIIALQDVIGTGSSIGFGMTWSINGGSSYLTSNYQAGSANYTYNSITPTVSSSTSFGRLLAVNANDILSGFIYLNLPSSGISSYVAKLNRTTTTPSLLTFYSWGTNTANTSFVNTISIALNGGGNIPSGVFSFYGLVD